MMQLTKVYLSLQLLGTMEEIMTMEMYQILVENDWLSAWVV